MKQPPIDQSEIDARISDHLEELLHLWWIEQGGPTKDRDLQIMSSSIPAPPDRALRTLDLCCGPGDLGRAIRQLHPDAQLDFVDRDPLLLSICRGVNERTGVAGTCRQLDLNDQSWCQDLPVGGYDAIAVANALHWLSASRAEAVVHDIHRLLDAGGSFVFAEPAGPAPPFAPGFAAWKEQQPPRYDMANWTALWGRVRALVGYDHPALWGARAADRIGETMTVRGWIDLVATNDFQTVDVLWRDADVVIVAARKD
jgi:SAM-dependent methyltransferase